MNNFLVFKETLKNLGRGEFTYYCSSQPTNMQCPTCRGERSAPFKCWGQNCIREKFSKFQKK